jgi:hypothetical protein
VSPRISVEDFVKCLGSSPTPEDVADAVVELASYSGSREGKAFLLSRKGWEMLA